MPRRVTPVLGLVVTAALAGCGTVSNVTRSRDEGGCRVFGGARHEAVSWGRSVAECYRRSMEEDEPGYCRFPTYCYLTAVMVPLDFPFTVAGDLLTLPYTVPCAIRELSSGKPLSKPYWHPDDSLPPGPPTPALPQLE